MRSVRVETIRGKRDRPATRPDDLRHGVRDDDTVEGCTVETHWLPLEYATLDEETGYFRFVADGGPVNYEIRVPWESVADVVMSPPGDSRGDRDDPPSRVNPDGEAANWQEAGVPERSASRSGEPSGPRGPLEKWARDLAMLALQSDRYASDPMFGEAVDMVLAYTDENGRAREETRDTGLGSHASRKVAEDNADV